MSEDQRSLVDALSGLTMDSWGDEALRNQLESQPRSVLAERGLEVSERVEVSVRFVEPVEPGEEQVKALADVDPAKVVEAVAEHWERGIESGRLELVLPDREPEGIQTAEISDRELEAVAGGISDGDKALKTFGWLVPRGWNSGYWKGWD